MLIFVIILVIVITLFAVGYYSVKEYQKTLGKNNQPTANNNDGLNQQNHHANLNHQPDFNENFSQDFSQNHIQDFSQVTASNGNQFPDGSEVAPFLRYCREVFSFIYKHYQDTDNIQDYFHQNNAKHWQNLISSNENTVDNSLSGLLANITKQGTVADGEQLLYDWVKVRFSGRFGQQDFAYIFTWQKNIDGDEWLIHDIVTV
ncbi:hypothetical protein [Acinetobacter sp. c1-l78]|uniref:hypothetical protein n=1 Tax=Acinetobacter sp. c1-l78 TaxID=3342803 RepID=UPI0035BB269C